MGNYTWNGIKDWAYGEQVYTSDMNAYVSHNVGFIFEEFPPNFFGAARAILPSSDAATSAQYQPIGSFPNWMELVFSGAADQSAQWNFRSWFSSSDMTGVRIRAYTTDATASTDDVDITVGIAAISSGDGAISAKAFVSWPTVTISAATLEDTTFTFKTYDIAASGATDWDSIAVGDLGVLQVTRNGSADDMTLDLHVERVWFY